MSCPPGTMIQESESMGGTGRINSTHMCLECFPGFFSSSVNSPQCNECQPGSYNDKYSSARYGNIECLL